MTQIPTITEYYQRLKGHDWYFCWCDDPRAYKAGSADADELEMIAKNAGGKHAALLKFYTDAMISGDPWKTEKVDPPPAPVTYTLYDLIDLRADFEKEAIAILADQALVRVIGHSGEKLAQAHEVQPHQEVIQKVQWMAFYSDPDADYSIFFKNTPALQAAWESGQKLGMEIIAQGEPA